MKRTLFFMLLSALLWGGGATTFAAARLPYDFEHGGMYYYISYVDEVTLVSGDVKYSGNVSIPDTIVQDGKNYRITAIGDYAFDGCSNLTEITIPETVKEIGEYAFHDCELLITVTIPGSVTTIGNYAFYSCDKLTQVILNTGLQTIGIDAFTTCPRLRSVTIPNSVTTIGSMAFSGCSNLQEITIGTGVKTIGDRAFDRCSSLKTVRITDIAAWCQIAFDGRASNPLSLSHNFYVDGDVPVTELDIPAEVTSIGSIAFINCTGLTSVKIPGSVATIGESAFFECTGLRTADIAAETIGKYAFDECTGLETVTLGETVKNIEYGAFHWCHALSGITIPANATLGEVAFENCNNMKTLTLNEGIKTIPYSAFSRCSSLTSVSIPNSVTSIGNSAFSQCTALRSVTLGDHVETIGAGAFIGLLYGVPLKSITIPESVKKIGSGAFPVVDSICITNLKAWCEIEFEDTNPLANGHLYWNGQLVTSLTIPAGITEIKNYAFSGWKDLKSLVIPAGVTRIGKEAFANCSSLKSLQMGEDVEFIGEKAFYNCANLQSLTMPDAVTEVGRYAFSGCTELKTVKISENLETINDQTFYGCASIDSIKIPDNTRSIGGSAFSKCSSLKSVKLGKGLRTIGGEWAFNECTSLASITIPDNVTTIGNFTFSECTNLKSVKIGNGIEVTNRGLFRECKKLKSVEMGSNLTEISGEAFSHCISLDSITLPASVTKIGSSAFANCDSLTTITGPRVISIESSAFSECKSLTSVKMDRIENIGYKAFEGCTSLASITLPKSITKIDGLVFQNCTGLTSVKVYNPKPITLSYDPFSGVDCANDTLYVPAGSIAAYQAAEVWNTFGTILSISDPVSKNFTPTTVSPADSAKVTELAKFTLVFDEKPNLVKKTATLTKGEDSYAATLAAGEGDTLVITLDDTLKVVGEYTLTIPEGTFGDDAFAVNSATGHCNPQLTYTYYVVDILPELVKDFAPTDVTPADSSEVMKLSKFTLLFGEKTVLVGDSATLMKADSSAYFPADIVASSDSTLTITLTDTVVTESGDYLLTIAEGTFGDATFAGNQTAGRCNPALTYVYYIEEDTVPEVPELVKDFMPMTVTPADSAQVTKLAEFRLLFDEKPVLVGDSATLMKADSSAYFPADIVVSSDSTLMITLTDTVVTESGDYLLTIPEGAFGNEIYFDNPTTGRCNPELTYTYCVINILPEATKDFMPMTVTPADSAQVTELAEFTLLFDEKPYLVGDSATLMKADSSAYFPAGIVASSDSTLTITLTDTVVTESGNYLLTIPEGAFGNEIYFDDPTAGRCNPALTYVYTIKEDTVPEVPELAKDFMPMRIAPADSAEVTELAEFTLLFDEKPYLVGDSATLMKADSSAYFPAGIVASSDSTLTITLTDTVVTESGDYLLTIPEGTFGDTDFAADSTTGHCNPELTYTYCVINILPEATKDFMPTDVTPADSAEVTELAEFTLLFDEKPYLVGDSATLMKADSSAYFPADIVVSSDSTLMITLTDTVVTESGNYLLTIPEGAFGNEIYFDNPTTGRCNPALTYTYYIVEDTVPELVKDFMPTDVTPADSAEVTELAEFTLLFDEKPFLVGDSATLMKADSSAYFPAGIVASSDSTLTITLTDTVVTESGNYLLTIPEGAFGNEIYFDDPTAGRCNPELTYTYYIVEDTVPDEPVKPELVKDFMPTDVTPADSAEVTELWQFTLTFDTKPLLISNNAMLENKAGTIFCLAEITESEGNTLVVRLKSNALTIADTYKLTIPEGAFGDEIYFDDQTTGHCNPALTYVYTIKEDTVPDEPETPEMKMDFIPATVTPTDSTEVTELWQFTLTFDTKPVLIYNNAMLQNKAGTIFCLAEITEGEGNTLVVRLKSNALTIAGTYTLTIYESSFGDAAFADDQTTGHCNPELVYTYTINGTDALSEIRQADEHIAVYNLQGVLILETNDADDLKMLQKGAYIVNGKKMIIAR